MINDVNKYYTLRLKDNDGLHKAGDMVACGNDILNIGQSENCELRLPNKSLYEDEQIAVIKGNNNIDGWHIIKMSSFIEVMVNGEPVEMVRYLADGDRITFSGIRQELLFNIHSDDRFNASNGVVNITPHVNKLLIITPIAIVLLMLCGLFTRLITSEEVSTLMNERTKKSVFMTCVDSVELVKLVGGQVVERCDVATEGAVGTSFLTDDSLLVTARHCVEPWLNSAGINIVMRRLSYIDTLEKPVAMALQAETYNRMHQNDTVMAMISYISITDSDGNVHKMLSTDFTIDKSRDDIIEIGDIDNCYYWRSIARHNEMTDMMLGDIAVAHFNAKGRIILAGNSLMHKLFAHQGRHIEFFGYPNYSAKGCMNTSGEVSLQVEENFYGGFGMIAHGGDLHPGFSGGPALMRNGMKCYAVGVISVTDKNGGTRSYSVPVSEVSYIMKGGRK